MPSSTGSDLSAGGEESRGRSWLVLTHHVPPAPAYQRVKVRRHLHRIGAVALKNSVYVLPPGEDTREDFEWLGREIERNGGEATLCLASFLDDATDGRILAAFRAAREADYRSIAESARALHARTEEDLMKGALPPTRTRGARLRRSLGAVVAIDFFGAPGRREAERAIAELEGLAREGPVIRSAGAAPEIAPPRAGTWVTREGIKVDRMASAWLVRRFIDPAASFKFVPPRGYRPREGEIRFDMFDGEFTHEDDRCTFETLLERFRLTEPALAVLGEIVHDIDCKDEKFGRAETVGVSALIDGITRGSADDDERLRQGTALFESLYEHFRSR